MGNYGERKPNTTMLQQPPSVQVDKLSKLDVEVDLIKAKIAALKNEVGNTERSADSNVTAVSTPGSGNKVLVIDHVRMFRTNLASILMSNGYKVIGEIGTPDESAIIETVLLKAPTIVAIDYHMPCLNCVNVIKRLKNVKPDLIVIITCAEISQNDMNNLLKAGAHDFVTKPLQYRQLFSVLSRQCDRLYHPTA